VKKSGERKKKARGSAITALSHEVSEKYCKQKRTIPFLRRETE